MTTNEINSHKPSSPPDDSSDLATPSALAKAVGHLKNRAEAMDELLACQSTIYDIQSRSLQALHKLEIHPHYVRGVGRQPLLSSLLHLYETACAGSELAQMDAIESAFIELCDAASVASDFWRHTIDGGSLRRTIMTEEPSNIRSSFEVLGRFDTLTACIDALARHRNSATEIRAEYAVGH